MEDPQILDSEHNSQGKEPNLYYTASINALLSSNGKFAIYTAIFFIVNVFIGIITVFVTAPKIGGLMTTLLSTALINLVIYGISIYYTFIFGKSVKKGVELNEPQFIEEGFLSLKRYFKFLGILIIIILGFFLFGVISFIVFDLMMN